MQPTMEQRLADLQQQINLLIVDMERLQEMVRRYRQTDIMRLGAAEDFLEMQRTIVPKHRRVIE